MTARSRVEPLRRSRTIATMFWQLDRIDPPSIALGSHELDARLVARSSCAGLSLLPDEITQRDCKCCVETEASRNIDAAAGEIGNS